MRGEHRAAYAGIIGALRAGLSARLNEAVGGLTLQMLHAQCLERGMPHPLADRIVRELERCEQARFDPSSHVGSSLETTVAQAQELLRQLARFSPKGVP